MRLITLNFTNGLYEIIGGGLNHSSVTFNFKGPDTGKAYDFNLEIFGNSANHGKLSMILVILLGILYALLK